MTEAKAPQRQARATESTYVVQRRKPTAADEAERWEDIPEPITVPARTRRKRVAEMVCERGGIDADLVETRVLDAVSAEVIPVNRQVQTLFKAG